MPPAKYTIFLYITMQTIKYVLPRHLSRKLESVSLYYYGRDPEKHALLCLGAKFDLGN